MVLDEMYALIKHSNFSFNDLNDLPTYKRRYFINKLKDDIEEINKQNESISNSIKKR
jgi:hypothetical protein